jgi:hypothetical protein
MPELVRIYGRDDSDRTINLTPVDGGMDVMVDLGPLGEARVTLDLDGVRRLRLALARWEDRAARGEATA